MRAYVSLCSKIYAGDEVSGEHMQYEVENFVLQKGNKGRETLTKI